MIQLISEGFKYKWVLMFYTGKTFLSEISILKSLIEYDLISPGIKLRTTRIFLSFVSVCLLRVFFFDTLLFPSLTSILRCSVFYGSQQSLVVFDLLRCFLRGNLRTLPRPGTTVGLKSGDLRS